MCKLLWVVSQPVSSFKYKLCDLRYQTSASSSENLVSDPTKDLSYHIEPMLLEMDEERIGKEAYV